MDNSPKLYEHSLNTQLEYVCYGNGHKALICFHGFGQHLQVYEDLSPLLPDYQVISVHLFFHGKSKREKASKYLTHEEWRVTFEGFLSHLNISRFSVMGYSLGGRYTSSTILNFQDRVDHCFFVAPDGIVKRSSYEFATFPLGSEQLFGFFMRNPKPFFGFLWFIEKTGLFNQWTIDFSRSQLRDSDQRMRVFHSWITLRKFRQRHAQLIRLINTAPFQTIVIFGKYDKIIQPKRHLFFLNKLKKAKVLILDTGHTKLLHESFTAVSQILQP